MAQPYVGEIRMFAGTFATVGWEFCEGQLLPISENETLFQLIGTTYGGDGQSTFALPDLRGRIPVHQGNGYILAEAGGVESVTLTVNQIPAHTHPLVGSTQNATNASPQNNVTGKTTANIYASNPQPGDFQNMSPSAIGGVGGSQPHDNMHPFVGINFIISLFGIFPTPT